MLAYHPWITTTILTLFIVETAITLFATLDNLIAAKCPLRHLEAIAFLTLFYGIEDIGNVSHGTCGEFAVIWTIATCSTSEHDIVAVDATRTTIGRVIMLKKE